MSNIDLVKQVFSEIEQGNVQEAGKKFSDDFTFKGPSLMALTKEQYLSAHKALVEAIPDWKFNATDWQEQGDIVKVNVHITGTHTRILRYPFPQLKEEVPTDNSIILPEEPTRVTVQNGMIAAMEADTVPGGGIRGVLQQLGIKPPIPVGV
jgi:hypothetical protein